MRTPATIAIAPLWVSPFRPFFLAGALYGIALMIAWVGAHLGVWQAPSAGMALRLWHGHEMLFGFAAAIVAGIIHTALPSWIGAAEMRGSLLIALVVAWAAGRLGVWGAALLPPRWGAALDLLFLPFVVAVVTPMLLRASNRLYLLLLPILAVLAGANLAWHVGSLGADPALAAKGLRSAVYALVTLYVLAGGMLTSVFTGNTLREKRRGDQPRFVLAIEATAVVSLVLLAALDICGARSAWKGGTALICALVHGYRVMRWKGWHTGDEPLVVTMHLGFVWLLFALLLKAVAEFAGFVPEATWVHAFTVGSLGMMMLGLMTRVVLRHTGRPLVVPRAMLVSYALMFVAALLRLVVSTHGFGNWAIAFATVAWVLPFGIYLSLYARALFTPSLPRARPGGGP